MTPPEALRAARKHFPRAQLGAGTLAFFTEFNRCPPDEGADFITHCTTALVHAAGDEAVMQTLQALPDVFASARAHRYGARAYIVGPSFIGMRFDPDGAALDPNPNGGRCLRTARDPRQRALFGAAWACGYVVQAARAGVDGVTLAEITGPFGVQGERGLCPLFHVLRGLGTEQAKVLATHMTPRLAALRFGHPGRAVTWLANLTPDEQPVPDACAHAHYAVLDAARVDAARQDAFFMLRTRPAKLSFLAPYAVARLTT